MAKTGANMATRPLTRVTTDGRGATSIIKPGLSARRSDNTTSKLLCHPKACGRGGLHSGSENSRCVLRPVGALDRDGDRSFESGVRERNWLLQPNHRHRSASHSCKEEINDVAHLVTWTGKSQVPSFRAPPRCSRFSPVHDCLGLTPQDLQFQPLVPGKCGRGGGTFRLF
jgi:hypothetical protein